MPAADRWHDPARKASAAAHEVRGRGDRSCCGRRDLIEAELDRLDWRPQLVINDCYDRGSMLTLHTVADAMTRGGEVLLMDADVMYHEQIMAALVDGLRPANRLLIDRNFPEGDEPVKVCVRDGKPIELRKRLAPGLQHDTIGE